MHIKVSKYEWIKKLKICINVRDYNLNVSLSDITCVIGSDVTYLGHGFYWHKSIELENQNCFDDITRKNESW